MIAIVTVFVEDIATALDEHFTDWQQFLNIKTGEIEVLSNDKNLDTNEELAEKIDTSNDYIKLPSQYDLNEYQIMENFSDNVNDVKIAKKLWIALNGRKPFRHFKDTINYLGIAQDYYKFRFKTYLDIAVEWCEDNKIPYKWKNPPKDFLDDNNASYDTLAKRILSRKVILARILKYTVPEFADCSLEDIAGKYIEGDPTADINTIPLDDTLYIKGSQKVKMKATAPMRRLLPSTLFLRLLLLILVNLFNSSSMLNLRKPLILAILSLNALFTTPVVSFLPRKKNTSLVTIMPRFAKCTLFG